MSIIISQPTSERGRQDARRHREKQREAIIDKLPEIISNESIITKKKGKLVKIPIRSIDLPHFRPASQEGPGEGIGQGPGTPGDIIGQKPGYSGIPGVPGTEPGEHTIETEIEIDELIELMLEDLGLPNLEEKRVRELAITMGYKIAGIIRSGPWPLLDRRATGQEGMRRFRVFLETLMAETNKPEIVCYNALKQSDGILSEALELLKGEVVLTETEAIPFPIFASEDMRFRQVQEDTENQSNAVIIAMMDISGSMGEMKKYLAKAMLWWLVRFLEKLYKNVEARFIVHDTSAQLVSEEDFFRIGENGGTYCYTAYKLANELIESDYPTENWNIYVWHFSDGEDGDYQKTQDELKKIMEKKINMVGYGEVQPGIEDADRNPSLLWKKFQSFFSLRERDENSFGIAEGTRELPLLCVRITDKSHILPAIQAFLKKDRWAS